MIAGRSSFLLWVALMVCVPVPFYLLETGREPVAGLVHLFAVTAALILKEGAGGAAPTVAWILAAQGLAAAAVLAVVARLGMRLLVRVFGGHGPLVALLLVGFLIAFVSTRAVYVTPFRSAGLRSTLPEVFE